MPHTALTASERATLLRYASSLPKGNETRRAILAAFGKLASSRMELPISLEVKIEGLQDHPAWRDSQKIIAEASLDKSLDPDVKDDLREVWKHIEESRAALDKAMRVLERM